MTNPRILDPDHDALGRAIALTCKESVGRRRQVESMLQERPWEAVGRFCATLLQGGSLRLKPWESAPAEVTNLDSRYPDERMAAQLVQELSTLGLSKYEPDPLAAIERARLAKASPPCSR
jgi:hypothetical protein